MLGLNLKASTLTLMHSLQFAQIGFWKYLPMLLEKMQIYKNKKNKFKKEDDISMVIVEAVKRFEEDLKEEEK